MAFEAFVEAGPHCEGDPIVINYCNCPDGWEVAIRILSPLPAPPVVYTALGDGVSLSGVTLGVHTIEIVCCEQIQQDPNNPYTPLTN